MIDKVNWEKVNGLLPVIVQDELEGTVLMLGYMNREALETTLNEGVVTFYSRSKARLWKKGETSGHYLHVKQCSLDCDNDTLLITATPLGAVCHLQRFSCFEKGFVPFLQNLSDVIDKRFENGSKESYVKTLHDRGTARIAQKVGEEGVEVAIASMKENKDEIIEESADLLFHMLVNLRYHKIEMKEVFNTLRRRAKA